MGSEDTPSSEDDSFVWNFAIDVYDDDILAHVEKAMRLGALGRFNEARKVWSVSLSRQGSIFEVLAEELRLMYDQGDFRGIIRRLETWHVDQKGHAPLNAVQSQILKLFDYIARCHSAESLPEEDPRLISWWELGRCVRSTSMLDLTEEQILLCVLALKFKFLGAQPVTVNIWDSSFEFLCAENDSLLIFVEHLINLQQYWAAECVLEIYMRQSEGHEAMPVHERAWLAIGRFFKSDELTRELEDSNPASDLEASVDRLDKLPKLALCQTYNEGLLRRRAVATVPMRSAQFDSGLSSKHLDWTRPNMRQALIELDTKIVDLAISNTLHDDSEYETMVENLTGHLNTAKQHGDHRLTDAIEWRIHAIRDRKCPPRDMYPGVIDVLPPEVYQLRFGKETSQIYRDEIRPAPDVVTRLTRVSLHRETTDAQLLKKDPSRINTPWESAAIPAFPELTHPRLSSPEDISRLPVKGSRAFEAWQDALRKVRRLYKYRDLPKHSTRLIMLHPLHEIASDNRQPNTNPEDIVVDIMGVALADIGRKYEFEAISYSWEYGTPRRSVRVCRSYNHVDFISPRRYEVFADVVEAVAPHEELWVQDNLYSALSNVRRMDGPVMIWVDAICMNMRDTSERQTMILHQVFSRANKTIVWLGDSDGGLERAMKMVLEVVRLEHFGDLADAEKRSSDWISLLRLMQNKYFSRRWTVQELALAQTAVILCGKYEATWRDFYDAVSLYDLEGRVSLISAKELRWLNVHHFVPAKLIADTLNNLFRVHAMPLTPEAITEDSVSTSERRETPEAQPLLGLEELVSSLSTLQVSDPRDTIFALRNIAKETILSEHYPVIKAPPVPDYKKNLLEVYTGFVAWIVQQTGCIDILCRRWATPEIEGNFPRYTKIVLPSWIQCNAHQTQITPENLQGARIHGVSFVGLPGRGSYDASLGKRAMIWFGEEEINVQRLDSTSPDSRGALKLTSSKTEPHIVIETPVVEHSQNPLQDWKTATSTRRPLGDGSSHDDRRAYQDRLRQHYEGSINATLRVQGLFIGTISWCMGAVLGLIPNDALERLQGGKALEKASERLWRTLVADRGDDRGNAPLYYGRACSYCLERREPTGHLDTAKILDRGTSLVVHKFLRRVQHVIWDRRFFEVNVEVNDNFVKLPGVGPYNLERGDIVCILFGCSVPCILRPQQDSILGTHYTFLGEAFVYDLMDGEAVRTGRFDKQEQVFTIL